MIEVFKTDVPDTGIAELLTSRLLLRYPQCRINFDLQDCDRILRVEGQGFCKDEVIALLNRDGFQCCVLE